MEADAVVGRIVGGTEDLIEVPVEEIAALETGHRSAVRSALAVVAIVAIPIVVITGAWLLFDGDLR